LLRTATRLLLAAALTTGLAASCSDDGSAPVLEVTTTTGADNPSAEPAEGDLAEEVPVGELRLTEVASVDAPTALAPDPTTGALYVTEQDGRVVAIDPTSGESQVVLDISDDVTSGGERGLLGITFDPDGEHLYISYTDSNGDTSVEEYQWSDGAVVAGSRRQVLAQDQPFGNHNGGDLHFGPDGYLYIGLGDGGAGGDPTGTGQDPSDLLGSILRIDPTPTGDAPYSVPGDNPFVGGEGAPEVWLFGVRNPWRFSFDLETGDLWIGDVGQNEIEEIDFLSAVDGVDAGKGANLGWAAMEGTSVFDGAEPADHVPPIHDYTREGGTCSVTGGYAYRGSAIPGLRGRYLYGDYCAGELRTLRVVADRQVTDESLGLSVGTNTLASFGEDLDGELYVLSIDDGVVYRLEPG
jgi:glucose/arabinose dehydrogenase